MEAFCFLLSVRRQTFRIKAVGWPWPCLAVRSHRLNTSLQGNTNSFLWGDCVHFCVFLTCCCLLSAQEFIQLCVFSRRVFAEACLFVDHTPGLCNEPDLLFIRQKHSICCCWCCLCGHFTGNPSYKKDNISPLWNNPVRNIFNLPHFACVDHHFERLASKTVSSRCVSYEVQIFITSCL